jgi:hypothetical protein
VFNIAGPAGMPGWLWASVQGATVGAVSTGSSSGAAWGAVTALAFYGVGRVVEGPEPGASFSEMVQDGRYWAKVSVHAATGGILSDLQGGKFGHGFVTAGVSAGASPLIDTIGGGQATGRPARIVVQALVGGAVSKGMGGDFANGAVTAAFARVFGEAATGGDDMMLGSGDVSASLAGAIDTSMAASGFSSRNDAARAFGDVYGPMSVDGTPQEFAAGIIKVGPDNFGYTAALEGAVRGRTLAVGALHRALGKAYGRSYVAMAHTHWDANQSFSSYDLHFAQVMPLYLRNTSGQTRLLDRSIINRTLQSSNIRGANRIQTYLQTHSTIPGVCTHGCD